MPEDIDIVISDDGLKAHIKQVTPQTDVEDVLAALKSAGVVHGISGESIQNAVSSAQKANRPIGDVLAAQGDSPKPAAPPRIDPPDGVSPLESLAGISKMLQLEAPGEISETAARFTVKAVAPGQELGTLHVEEGEPGKSVTGQEIVMDTVSEKTPAEPGPGVAKSGTTFTASTYGYAGLLDGQAAVLPPFWISADAMVAAFVNVALDEASHLPSPDELTASAKEAGITWGLDSEAVADLCDSLGTRKLKPLIAIARGQDSTDPVDATPEFSFPYLIQSGLVQEDGSIDFTERNSFPGVAEGETLAEGKAGVPGAAGHTVRGDELELHAPVEAELVAGEGVRLEGTPPNQRLISDIEGGASCQTTDVTTAEGTTRQYRVSVRPVAQISGDVDYETGNLDFRGNVEIKGSVLSPFTVKASGDIRVGETVEAGAQVYGEANLVVKLGIVGENTIVKTDGNVTAKFIQDATVTAGGDIAVGSYIRSARVSSSGSISVEGSGGAVGVILGGEVWASEAIASKNVGSESTQTTTISLGIDQESYESYTEAVRLAARAQDLRESLLKSIGISRLDAGEIKQRIRSQPHRKNEILRYVQKANDLAIAEQEHQKVINEVGGKMRRSSQNAHLDVSDTAYPKVTIRIGNSATTLDTPLKNVSFRLDSKDGVKAYDQSGTEGEPE